MSMHPQPREEKNVQNSNGDKPMNVRDWFRLKGSPGELGVSYHRRLTKMTPFTSVLGESGSLITNCSQGLWVDMDRQLLVSSFKV